MAMLRGASWLALTCLCLVVSGCCPLPGPPPPTPGFWGPDDFQGSYDPTKDMVMNVQTTYDGDIVFANLPRTVVDDVLPADLQLAPNVGDMPTQHPVVLVFGTQTKLQWILPPIPAGNDYHELILIIPFVQKVGGQKWHNYVVRMYLDWQLGVDGGNFMYGYMKELGVLTKEFSLAPPPEFVFKVSRGNADKFRGEVTGVSALMKDSVAQTSLTNYQAMKTIFTMPILGTMTTSAATTSYVCSYFLWNWDMADVRKASTRLQFLSDFVPNMSPWVAQGPINNLANGDFGVTGLVWELTAPKACVF